MANQEIHNYVDEQITPEREDFLDIDAYNGGNPLSKKMKVGTLKDYVLKFTPQPSIDLSISSGVVVLDCSAGNYFRLTLTEDVTLNVTNLPSGAVRSTIVIECNQFGAGGHVITNGAAVSTYADTQTPNDGSGDKFDLYMLVSPSGVIYNVMNR